MNSLKEVEVRLVLRDGSHTLYSDRSITGAHEAIDVMKRVLKEMDREMLIVVNVNAKNCPINYSVVSIGTQTYSIVSVPDVFKSAILSNAYAIVLLHNHPSGEATPSQEDLDVTRKLAKAGNILQIKVLDHIIVGDGNIDVYSMFENCPEVFSENS